MGIEYYDFGFGVFVGDFGDGVVGVDVFVVEFCVDVEGDVWCGVVVQQVGEQVVMFGIQYQCWYWEGFVDVVVLVYYVDQFVVLVVVEEGVVYFFGFQEGYVCFVEFLYFVVLGDVVFGWVGVVGWCFQVEVFYFGQFGC